MKTRIATLAASTAVATALAAAPAGAETVKLVTGNGYKPHTDESLDHGGMFTQIVRNVYKNMGKDVKVDFKPWKRGEKMVLDDNRVAHFPLIKAEERMEKFHFSNPVTSFNQHPIVMKGNTGQYTSFADLDGTTGCLPTGWAVGGKYDEMVKEGDIDLTRAGIDNCFKLLKKGRIDYVPAALPTAQWAAKSALGSREKIEADALELPAIELHMVFDKDEEGRKARNEFNDGLEEYRATGEIDEIKKQWLN